MESTVDAPTPIPGPSQPRGLGEEMDGSQAVVQSQDHASQVQDPRATTSGPHGGRQQQKERRALLPAEIRTFPHRPVPQVDQESPKCQVPMVPVPVPVPRPPSEELSGMEDAAKSDVGEVKKETGRWKSRWNIRDLFADPRCSQAILDFLASTQVFFFFFFLFLHTSHATYIYHGG